PETVGLVRIFRIPDSLRNRKHRIFERLDFDCAEPADAGRLAGVGLQHAIVRTRSRIILSRGRRVWLPPRSAPARNIGGIPFAWTDSPFQVLRSEYRSGGISHRKTS